MNWVCVSTICATIVQIVVCGFSFPMFFSAVGRALFLCRAIGLIIPVKVCWGLEITRLFLTALSLVFTRSGAAIDWLNIIFIILFTGIVSVLYFIDDRFYLYVVEDDNDMDE